MKGLLIIFLLFQTLLFAENFSTSNVQFLYGNHFNNIPGDTINDDAMQTITFEHFGTWDYGNNFFFIDLTQANFNSGSTQHAYMEWTPALQLSKLTSTPIKYGIIKDVRIAAQLNQGENFKALMGGLGVELEVSSFNFITLDAYLRKDNFNKLNYQTTLVWKADYQLGSRWTFEGFLDWYGVDDGTIIISQPRLLLDGSFLKPALKNIQIGVELYIYAQLNSANDFSEVTPQLMIKWIW